MLTENAQRLAQKLFSGRALAESIGQLWGVSVDSNDVTRKIAPEVKSMSQPNTFWSEEVDTIESPFAPKYDKQEYQNNLALQLMSIDELQSMLAWLGVPIELQQSYAQKPLAGKSILNIGTGTGREVLPLAALGAEVVGFDATIEYVQITTQKIIELSKLPEFSQLSVDLFQCLAERYPYSEQLEKFDAITSLFGVINHIEDWRGTLLEMVRSLKSGGKLVLSTYGTNDALVFDLRQTDRLSYQPSILQKRDPQGRGILLGESDKVLPANFPTSDQIVKTLRLAGLQVEVPRGMLRLAALFPKNPTLKTMSEFINLVRQLEPALVDLLTQCSTPEEMLAVTYDYDHRQATDEQCIAESAYVFFTAKKP